MLFRVREPTEHKACLGPIAFEGKAIGDGSDEDLETIDNLCEYSLMHGQKAEAI